MNAAGKEALMAAADVEYVAAGEYSMVDVSGSTVANTSSLVLN